MMSHHQFNNADLFGMEKRFRTNLINSIGGFNSANLVGTISPEKVPNLAIFSSVVHIGANPPLVGMISRPDTVPRHTLQNIRYLKYYTINAITEGVFPQAHQTAARYDDATSEFDAVGLKKEFLSDFPAPFVSESPIQIGLELRDIIEIPINGTYVVIGEIQKLQIPQAAVLEDGKVDLEFLKIACISGLDTYHSTACLARLDYAKPGKTLKLL
ncbi:MAG: flavin reductase [Bacteroidota bacterium]